MHALYNLNSNPTKTQRISKVVPKLDYCSCAGFLSSSGILGDSDAEVEGQKTVNIPTQQIVLLKQAHRHLLEVGFRRRMNTAPVSPGGRERLVLLVSYTFTVQRSSAVVIHMKRRSTSCSCGR